MALSLPAKIAIGVSTLAGILTFALGSITFDLSRDRLMSAYDQQLGSQAESVARHLGQILRTVDRNLQANAGNTMFANALTDSAGRHFYLDPFLKDFTEVAEVPVFIELRDYRGRTIAANPLAASEPIAAERVMMVIEDGRARAWVDAQGGEPIVAMVAPIVYANTGKAEGALVYQFPLRAASDERLLHGIGDLTVDLRIEDENGERRVLTLGSVRGFPGASISGSRMVAMPQIFGGTVMRVRAGLPKALVDGALARLMTMYLLAAFGLLTIIVPVSLMMARGMLRRLSALESVANAVIATGRMNDRVEERGGDEIARLSSAFNHMLDRLHQAHEELEQVRAREVARYAERTRRILATTQEGYLLVAAEGGRVLEANDAFCQLFGARCDTLIGRRFPDFLTPVLDEVLMPGSPSSVLREVEAPAADGGRIVCLTNASVDVDENGDRCIFLFLTDISDRRAAEDALQVKSLELERSNAELQQFAYAASHDLQEPLRMVTAYLQLLRTKLGADADEETIEFLGFASDGSKRMALLIRDLLDYSRVGSRGSASEPVSCVEALDEAMQNLRVRIDEEGAEIAVAAPLPTIMGDRAQIVRLFQNIVGNAIKFRAKERPPRIEIAALPDHGGLCHLTVRDNGIGIDPTFHARIFEAFQRLHAKSEYEGTGLGLALVKRIVESHHGRVWVDSVQGEGSTFHIALPNVPALADVRAMS